MMGDALWQKGEPVEGVARLKCDRCRGSGTFEIASIISEATAARTHHANAILLPLRRRR